MRINLIRGLIKRFTKVLGENEMRFCLGILLLVLQGMIVSNVTAAVISGEELYSQTTNHLLGDLQAIVDDEETRTALGSGIDINEFVQAVLRESYLMQSAVLFDYADKVRRFNDLRDATRDALRAAREWKLDQQGRGFEAIPYLLYMGTTPSSESTEVTIGGFDEDSLNSVNAFLTESGLGNYSFVPSPIPIPATAWLFGVALIGFVGFSKRRKTA